MSPDDAHAARTRLLEALSIEDPITTRVIAAIPPEQITYVPGARCREANALAIHTVRAGRWFLRMVDGLGPPDETPEIPATKERLLEAVAEEQQHYRSRLEAFDAETLAAPCAMVGGGHTNLEVLSWHKDHMVHHRGQLTLYLRLMGAHVPATYGPSADEDMQP